MIAFFTIALGIGTIAGGYVSFYLTRFNPVDTLRNKSAIGSDKSVLRRALMATQMVIFGGLTLSSITIYKQLELFRNGDMGFTSTNLLLLYPDSKGFGRSFDAFKKELMNIPDIESVSGARTLPGSEVRAIMKLPRKNNPSETVSVEGVSVDKDFIETMGIKMVTGASFSDAGTNDSRRECLINESAMNEFGLLHPLGEEIGGLRIIGVVRDFRMHSFREKTSPLIITKGTQSIREVAIRTRLGSAPNTIKSIQDLSKDFNNGKFMEYETFDERLGPLYTQEHKFAKVIGYATGLAIFIACLGVYGMSVLVCHQRVKEIGVRKVLGASLHDIYFMVTREFLGLVLVSTVVALPLTIYFMNKWLQQFAYRTELDLWVFVLAVTIDTAIVLATVTVQATRAAAANPARSLRHE
jgi:putative ABC transport system permease protein